MADKHVILSNLTTFLAQVKSWANGQFRTAAQVDQTATAKADAALASAKEYADGKVAGKADKATTLAGYGIADAYTKAEADSAIAAGVANADHLKRTIVTALPAVADADEHTIYMVGTGDDSEDSAYEEYMVVNGGFEKVGSSAVDLTDYATKAYADGKAADAKAAAVSEATTAAAEDATTKADAAKATAVSTAAADATTKADAAKEAAITAAATDAQAKANAALASAKEYADGLGHVTETALETKLGDYVAKADIEIATDEEIVALFTA